MTMLGSGVIRPFFIDGVRPLAFFVADVACTGSTLSPLVRQRCRQLRDSDRSVLVDNDYQYV